MPKRAEELKSNTFSGLASMLEWASAAGGEYVKHVCRGGVSTLREE
jgi:hypothetical protein